MLAKIRKNSTNTHEYKLQVQSFCSGVTRWPRRTPPLSPASCGVRIKRRPNLFDFLLTNSHGGESQCKHDVNLGPHLYNGDLPQGFATMMQTQVRPSIALCTSC